VTDKRIGRWNGSSFTFIPPQFNIERPLQILEDKNGVLWHADLFRGIVRDEGSFENIIPNGPYAITCKEMDFLNGTMYVTSSDIQNSWGPAFNRNGFYASTNYNWRNYTVFDTPFLDSLQDVAVIKAIPGEGKLILGAHYTGIVEFNPADNSVQVFAYRPNNGGKYRVTGADLDAQGNVWMSDAYSNTPLICRKADGTYKYFQSGFMNGDVVKDVVADDYNNIFVAKDAGDGGLVVFNYGQDIDDLSDDRYISLSAEATQGNLPSNNVICLAKDLDGTIWLGTSQGIAIIPCPSLVIDAQCVAEQICVDRNDGSGFCDNLLEDETVNCIAVDAANRKWIGTNNGLFLVSADGLETIYKFTFENSPLLSNVIRSVAINPQNGDVFIGTGSGINTYRAEATSAAAYDGEVFVYPNPVYHDYEGPIAVKGLPDNSSVKITDAAGNLVFQTTSLGGQAIWDGRLVNGERAASGVYVVLSVSSDKKEKATTKFVLLH
jgi:ligand-binding sensor domain-containing protein